MADTLMDGKSLKQFVENDAEWAKFVDERFAKLDKSHKGKLTHSDMEPAISGVGKALGMPPMGTDPETDHIYTEMFSEFGPGGEGVTKEKFSSVMRDILLGLGDGLEREPVAISPLDGSSLEKFVRGPEFEVEAVAAFSVLDTDTSGQVKADAIRKAMGRLTVDQGMPPQTDASVSKYIDRAFQESGRESNVWQIGQARQGSSLIFIGSALEYGRQSDGFEQHARRPSPFKLWPDGMGMESPHREMGRKLWQTPF